MIDRKRERASERKRERERKSITKTHENVKLNSKSNVIIIIKTWY